MLHSSPENTWSNGFGKFSATLAVAVVVAVVAVAVVAVVAVDAGSAALALQSCSSLLSCADGGPLESASAVLRSSPATYRRNNRIVHTYTHVQNRG